MPQTQSLWNKSISIPPRDALRKPVKTDAIIIGAGMAGVLTAHELKRRGVKAVVLEAGRIASGQTGNTTAKITSQHDMLYDALIQKLGEEPAGQYFRANEAAIQAYASLISAKGIDCDFRQTTAWLYSTTASEPMAREAAAAKRLGADVCYAEQTELPFDVAGAVCLYGQAKFHPLKFLRAISADLEIYENTPVLGVEDNRVITAAGELSADHIIFTSHYPFINVPGWYFMRMHQERSYVLALRSSWLPEGVYYGVDNDGLSFREADGLLLVGGENHRTGENSGGGRYDNLRRRAHSLLPGCTEVACWSAQDCITLDGVPYIGQYAPSQPNWYVATGFGKWGMSTSMVSALLIAGQITGHTPEWAKVFTPARLHLSASAKSLATETAQAFKGMAREQLALPETALAALPLGHGGIVEADGKKAGVYKDMQGLCHIVTPRCPHLGCQLEWNPDELSWDCPCHGSRFNYDGALLDNPAQQNIKE